MVLQDVLETVGVGSLDDVTRRLVFEPLGMTASWFDTDDHQHARARGHLALGRVALPFVIVFVPVVLALVACASVARRLARRSWQPGAFGALVSLGIGAVLTAWFLNSRATTSQAALTFTLFGLATLAVPGLVFAALVRLVRVQRAAVRCAAGALGTCVVTAMLLPQAVPLPDMAPSGGNAASSLRTSARDLGQFLEECVRPRLLDASVASAFGSRQVALDHTAGWGLGIGVRTDANGVALFHWGSNPASRSFLLSYPGRGVGIVVLANGDLSRDAVVRIAELAVGGETAWQAY
jgi:CubicO group peptidase (beta-lactamase class C family)